jgi:hypothetical protein
MTDGESIVAQPPQVSQVIDPAAAANLRLQCQINYYEGERDGNRGLYQNVKVAQLVTAASVPILTAVPAVRLDQPWIIAALGATVVVLEGFQQLKGYHDNWLRFAQTAEALKREKYLHLARAGPYAHARNGYRLLEERVERIVSGETGTWAAEERQDQTRPQAPAKDGSP